jgi:hypothetical protein
MLQITQSRLFYATFSFLVVAFLSIAFFCGGTNGGGDSTLHYLFAHYAIQHPENLLNHWAKPFFTALALPFAIFGFTGIKLFNCLCSLGAIWFTYKICVRLNIYGAEWIGLFLASITLYVHVTFSGLTEPLSALMLMFSIYFVLYQRYAIALTMISFLPFVRSEGLIILGVFAIYLVLTKKSRYLPLLAFGHLIFSIAGSFYYHDFLWVFTKIPYAHLSSGYGKGNWTHYFTQLFFNMGPIPFSLLLIGGIGMAYRLFFSKENSTYLAEKLWLVYGCFVAFFIGHAAFWALGIFNSMGLTRVFVSVMPLAGIIVLSGLHDLKTLASLYSVQLSNLIYELLLALIFMFPFFKGPSSHKIPKNFELDPSQKLIKQQIVPYLSKKFPNHCYIIGNTDIALFTNKDPFDKKQVKMFYDMPNLELATPTDLIIHDSWYSPLEFGVQKDFLDSQSFLQHDTTFTTLDEHGKEVTFTLFIKRTNDITVQ